METPATRVASFALPYVRWANNHTEPAGTARNRQLLCDHQLIYVLSGQGVVCIDDRNHPAHPDYLFYLLPGTWYAFRADASEALNFISVHFDWREMPDSGQYPLYLEEFHERVPFHEQTLFPNWSPAEVPYLDLKGRPRIRHLLEETVTAFRLWDEVARFEAGGLLAAANAHIIRELNVMEMLARYEGVGADAMRRVERARSQLESFQQPPMTVMEVADSVGWSVDHLRHMFQTVLNISPLRLQRAACLRHAQELLRGEAMPISDIATLCGFEDQGYFARVFKEETGLTPREFRLRMHGHAR